MKTSTLLWIGGAAALGYYLATRKTAAAAAQAATAAQALTAPPDVAPVVVVEPDYEYVGPVPAALPNMGSEPAWWVGIAGGVLVALGAAGFVVSRRARRSH